MTLLSWLLKWNSPSEKRQLLQLSEREKLSRIESNRVQLASMRGALSAQLRLGASLSERAFFSQQTAQLRWEIRVLKGALKEPIADRYEDFML